MKYLLALVLIVGSVYLVIEYHWSMWTIFIAVCLAASFTDTKLFYIKFRG